MIWYSYPEGFLSLKMSRYFFRSLENKGVLTRKSALHDFKDRRRNMDGIGADDRNIFTNAGEVGFLWLNPFEATQCMYCFFVIDITTERVSRIGRIDD